MRWRAALAAAFPVLLLAACSGEAPTPAPPLPPPAFPTLADYGLERECRCVAGGECQVPELAEAFDGRNETRGFQCSWEDRASAHAACSWETRFRHNAPNSDWSRWSQSRLRFRHLGRRGWCWYDSASRSELTTDAPLDNYPPAVRQPTEAEANRIAAACGTSARRASPAPDTPRLAAWAVFEPVDGATAAQRACFMRQIRLLIARPAGGG